MGGWGGVRRCFRRDSRPGDSLSYGIPGQEDVDVLQELPRRGGLHAIVQPGAVRCALISACAAACRAVAALMRRAVAVEKENHWQRIYPVEYHRDPKRQAIMKNVDFSGDNLRAATVTKGLLSVRRAKEVSLCRADGGGDLVATWTIEQIRGYGYSANSFNMEVGRAAETGEGWFYFRLRTSRARELTMWLERINGRVDPDYQRRMAKMQPQKGAAAFMHQQQLKEFGSIDNVFDSSAVQRVDYASSEYAAITDLPEYRENAAHGDSMAISGTTSFTGNVDYGVLYGMALDPRNAAVDDEYGEIEHNQVARRPSKANDERPPPPTSLPPVQRPARHSRISIPDVDGIIPDDNGTDAWAAEDGQAADKDGEEDDQSCVPPPRTSSRSIIMPTGEAAYGDAPSQLRPNPAAGTPFRADDADVAGGHGPDEPDEEMYQTADFQSTSGIPNVDYHTIMENPLFSTTPAAAAQMADGTGADHGGIDEGKRSSVVSAGTDLVSNRSYVRSKTEGAEAAEYGVLGPNAPRTVSMGSAQTHLQNNSEYATQQQRRGGYDNQSGTTQDKPYAFLSSQQRESKVVYGNADYATHDEIHAHSQGGHSGDEQPLYRTIDSTSLTAAPERQTPETRSSYGYGRAPSGERRGDAPAPDMASQTNESQSVHELDSIIGRFSAMNPRSHAAPAPPSDPNMMVKRPSFVRKHTAGPKAKANPAPGDVATGPLATLRATPSPVVRQQARDQRTGHMSQIVPYFESKAGEEDADPA